MAAPSSTVWGSIAGSKGRIGIYTSQTSTSTQITTSIQVWFWSKYSVSDTSNTFYFNDNASSASTSRGSVSIRTTHDSGSGWSTTNQKKIYTYTSKVDRGTSAKTRKCAAKLSGIDVIGSTMTVSKSYTIPALASYTIVYNANGGSDAPANQTKYYGNAINLRTETPTRDGYIFIGWSADQTATTASYGPGDSYTNNSAITLYAVWAEDALLQTIKARYQNLDGSWGDYNTVYSAALQSGEFVEWSQDYSVEFKGVSVGYAVTDEKTTFIDIPRNVYKLYLNANGGIENKSVLQYFYGGVLKLDRRPTRSGYTFLGWSTDNNATEPLYTAKNVYDTLNTSGETLYAIWKKRNFVNIYLQNDCIAQANEYVEDAQSGFGAGGTVYAASFNEESTNNFTIGDNFTATALYESAYTKSFLVDNYNNILTDNSGNYFYVEVEEQLTDNPENDSENDSEGDTELITDVNLLSSDDYKLMSSDDLYLIAQQGGN